MKKALILFIISLLVVSLVPLTVGCESIPEVVFEASVSSGPAPLTVVFTNMTESSDSDAEIVFNWDFGDGNTKNTSSVEESVTHEYSKVGDYTVTCIFSRKDKPSKTSLATQTITVTHGPVDSVTVTPETVELTIGQSQSFSSEVFDACENPIFDALITWDAEAGTVTDQGVLTSGTKAGYYPEGVTAFAELETYLAKKAVSVTILPDPLDSATLSGFDIAAGETRQLEAVASDQYGNRLEDLEATWSLLDADAGAITEEGLYTAPKKAGVCNEAIQVEVKQRDKICKAVGSVTIVPGTLEQILAAPEKIELGMGMTQQFVAVGIDKFGNRISGLTFDWTAGADAGTISADGLFTASDEPGVYKDGVTVAATRDEVTRSKSLTITVEPDRVLFISNRRDEDKNQYDLYVMDIDGGNVKKITTARGSIHTGVACSPDGRRIIFNDVVPTSEKTYEDTLYLANVDGTWQTILLSGRRAFEPAWSHDGQKVAFQSWEHDPSEIYVMDIDGGNFQRLTNNGVYDDYPDWSPDDKKILFISEADTSWSYPRIYVMNADGSQVKKVTTEYTYDIFPQWSPDGKDILFQSIQGTGKSWGIFIIDANGGNLRTVTFSDDYNAYYPCWSPDGKKVAFTGVEKEEDHGEIYVVNRDGTDLVKLTDNTADDRSPKWLPRKQGVKVSEALIRIPESFEKPVLTAQEIAAMASGAVVRVEVELESGEKSGSGIILKSDGLILTSNHVVTDAQSITVYLDDGSSYDGTVEARDMVHDLAVISIEASGLPVLEIGDLSGVTNGQSVMVLGYPLGNQKASVTSGLVSSIEYDSGRNITWVQTDSAINPGNSGGPLLDMQGRVIGIVTAKYFGIGIEGMGYAISANTINLYLPDLMAKIDR